MRILLFNPPLYMGQGYIEAEECCFGAPGRPVVPCGLLRTASALREIGHDVRFVDYAIEQKPWSAVLREIQNWDLAVTSVIHGGFYHKQFLTFYEALRGQKNLITLCYPESYTSEIIAHLSLDSEKHAQFLKVVPPFNHEVHVDYSLYSYLKTPSKVFIVQATTGCRYNCNFCVWAGQRFQARNPANVVSQLAEVRRLMLPSDFVFLLSSQITGDKVWLRNFVTFKKQQVPDLSFQGDIGIGEVDEETAVLLKRSGIVNATVGAEALSDGWLRKFRKAWTFESIKTGCLNLQKAGVDYHIILRCGIGETSVDIAESIRNLKELVRVGVKPGYVKWGKIYPYRGTAIADRQGKQEFPRELNLLVAELRRVGWIK